MRNSPLMRAVRASVAGTLFLSLGFTPALAHGGGGFAGPGARAGGAFFHARPPGFHGFGHKAMDRRFFDGRGRFAFKRFNRNLFLNSGVLLGGCCGWGGPFVSSPSTGTEPIIVGAGGPPVVINLSPPGAAAGDSVGGGYEGACVVHQLQFDGAGKYIGERQYPQC